MRKLLLSTTAIIAAGAISSAAVADVSISGAYKFSYQNQDSGINTVGESGDRMWSEILSIICSSTITVIVFNQIFKN